MRAPLGTLARALFFLAGLLPWLPDLLDQVPGLSPLARPLELWFGLQCHREPGRSLSLFGELLPVCARCFGIYTGLGLGALLLRPRLGPARLYVWLGLAVLIMLLDVLTESFALRPASALLRAATGILLSWPIAVHLIWFARARSAG